MISIPTIPFRSHRKRTQRPPVALTLVAATYDSFGLMLILQFDRAIDLAEVAPGAFQVYDGEFNQRVYLGTGAATLDDPVTMRLSLLELNPIDPGNVSFFAADENGVVGIDGGIWAGVSDLSLPFP